MLIPEPQRKIIPVISKISNKPSGENLTQLTVLECLLRLERNVISASLPSLCGTTLHILKYIFSGVEPQIIYSNSIRSSIYRPLIYRPPIYRPPIYHPPTLTTYPDVPGPPILKRPQIENYFRFILHDL